MLIGAGGGEEETEIGLVLFGTWMTDGIDVDVIVTTSAVVAVAWLEQRGVIMASAWLVSTGKIAHQPATNSCMVTS